MKNTLNPLPTRKWCLVLFVVVNSKDKSLQIRLLSLMIFKNGVGNGKDGAELL